MKDKLEEYQVFKKEVIRKLIRAEIDAAVFEIRRNEMTRPEEERKEANDMFISTSETVADLNQVLGVIDAKIAELMKGNAKS